MTLKEFAECIEFNIQNNIKHSILGIGAPEIERRLYDSYNATADIYSFGITLYLLLNEFKFPGSDGYYPKVEVQYDPDFIFPAPINASEELARIIRKMCAYYANERYQTMNEVFLELAKVLDTEEIDNDDQLFELADIATETVKEEKHTEKRKKRQKNKRKPELREKRTKNHR